MRQPVSPNKAIRYRFRQEDLENLALNFLGIANAADIEVDWDDDVLVIFQMIPPHPLNEES
jgi:hypothetical protein